MFPVLCMIFGLASNFSRCCEKFPDSGALSLALCRMACPEMRHALGILLARGNKVMSLSSYCMNALCRGSRRPEKEPDAKKPFRRSFMTRARASYLKRNLVRDARAGREFPNPGVLLSCYGDAGSMRAQMTRSRSRFRLAIRLGRVFSARAACAPPRRIGISVWRSDFWVKPVRVC
jgi:hypothetical protein